MLSTNLLKDQLSLLNIPVGLIDLIKENYLDRDAIAKMTIDDLSLALNIDIEAAKLILNAVTNYSGVMHHDMRELR